MKTFNFYNLKGGIDFANNKTEISQKEALMCFADSENFEISESNTISLMKGNVQLANKAGVKILGIFDYIDNSENHTCLVNTDEGKLYKVNLSNGTWTLLHSGLDTLTRCGYVNAFGGCVISNGVDDPIFYDGSTVSQCNATTTVDGVSTPIRGQAIELYKGRIFIPCGGDLFYSALGKYNDWTTAKDAGYIPGSRTGRGNVIAVKNFGEYLAMYTDSQATLLTGNSPDNFQTETIADKGCVSPFGVITALNKQLFCGDGIYPLQYNTLGQIECADELSLLIKPDFSNFDTNKLKEITVVKHPSRDTIWFYCGYASETDLSVCWILHKVITKNVNNKPVIGFVLYKRVATPVTCATVYDGVILTGTSDGKILQEDSGDDFHGTAITGYIDLPYLHFGLPQTKKSADKIKLLCSQGVDTDFYFHFRKNYDDSYSTPEKHITIADALTLYWSDALYDGGNWDDLNWAQNKIKPVKIKIPGKFMSIQPRIRVAAGGNIEILGFEVSEVDSEE